MGTFRYTEDIEEWLKPLGYNDFWHAVIPYRLQLPNKLKCDEKITREGVDKTLMLAGLKYITVVQLSSHFGIGRRPLVMPDYSARA